ncbi:MAG: biosynthetic-type acetolactate synthase large subunit [Ruminiclostridium sp.]
MLMKGSDIIVECLLEQGVDTVFGYPGGAVLDIYDSLYKYSDRLSHVLTAHEQGASHAADGYARATGKTGVVIATSGPGATNLVTGIATAYMDSIPMVAITGNVSCPLLGLDSFQEVDITGITLPITKHNFIVKDTAKLADTIRLAFRIAESGRKGPVLIDIPKDITQKSAEYERKEKEPAFETPAANEQDIMEAVEMLANAKRPYIYTGGGIISADACKELAEFAELLDAPVSSSLMGQGCFDQTNPRYIGMLGMHGTKAAAETIKNCDLFIALGTRFSDRVTGNTKTFASDAKILQIDIDSAEMGKNVEAQKVVVGDVKEVLGRINKLLPKQNHAEWTANSERMAKTFTVTMKGTEALPVTPDYLIETLDRLTEGNAVIATEVGQNQMWAAQYYKYRNPRSFISSGGLGTMGYGLGAAMGAKVGCPHKVVVNIAGDGSFHMNLNELVTASKSNIRIIELVINNDVLGMVRQWQRLFYSEHYSHTTLERPTDYVKLGEAFGIKALVIEKKEDVERVLKEALEESKTRPVLIECRIDKDINVLPMVPAGKSITEPIMAIEV